MMRKKTSDVIFTTFLLALLTLAGCSKSPEAAENRRPVVTTLTRLDSIDRPMTYSGVVSPRVETKLSFRVTGKITSRLVEVGQTVKAGQTLATLDPQDLRWNAAVQQAQFEATRAEAQKATADLERYQSLYEKKFISKAEFDQRKLTLDVARSKFKQAGAQLAYNNSQVSHTNLVADHDGVVTAVDAEAGQVVSPGQNAIRVARVDAKEVRIDVPESRVGELRKAASLRISLWSLPNRQLRGELREISPQADPVTRTYTAKVAFIDADADADIRLGMTASVMAPSNDNQKRIKLPLSAIVQRGDQPTVWVVDAAKDQVKSVPVKIGDIVGNDVAINEGLSAGQRVVIAGATKLVDGQLVRLLKGKQS